MTTSRSTSVPVSRVTTTYGGDFYSGGHWHWPGTSVLRSQSTQNGSVVYRSEVITSVSTGPSKRIVYVRWKPKRSFVLAPPQKPVLHLPDIPKYRDIKPPVLNGSASRRKRILKRFKERQLRHQAAYAALVVRLTQRRAAKIAKFNLALKRYEKRLAIYNRVKQLVEKGVPRRKRVVTPGDRPWTSYSRVRITDSGYYINATLTTFYYLYSRCNHGYGLDVFDWGAANYWAARRVVTVGVLPQAVPAFPDSVRNSALASAEAAATSRLHEMVKDASAHIGNIVAERAQTLGLVSSAVKALSTFLEGKRSLLSLLKSAAGSPKEIADATLAIQFGVRPLISDVHEAAVGLAKALSGPPPTIRAKGSGRGEASSLVQYTGNGGTSTYRQDYSCKVKVSYTMEFTVGNSVLSGLSQWGLVNPAEIAWELTPWSFAIDWVLPIGGWISSLTSDAGLSFVRGVKVVTVTETTKISVRHSGKRFSNIYTLDGFESQTYVKETKTRTPSSFPDYVLAPKNPFSVNHIVDSLALLVQLKR